MFSENIGLGMQSVHSLCLTPAHQFLPERNLYTLQSPDFYDCQPGDISRSLDQVARRADPCVQSHRTISVSLLSKLLPEGLSFLISLNLHAARFPALEHLTGLGTPLITRS